MRYILAIFVAIALVLSGGTAASAATDVTKEGSFFLGFNNTYKPGKLAAGYKNYWQPYPNGMSGKYYSNDIVSTHDGYMDVAFTKGKGAAGTFGSPSKAYSHIGGTFSIRLKATGGATNGIAVMLWPSSDDWGDGEIDYPEGGLNSETHIFHHWMAPKDSSKAYHKGLGNKWGSWHTYTVKWDPGKSVKYYLDGKLVWTVTEDVPTSEHRFMFQTSNNGSKGHLLIDWVRTTQ